MRWSKEGKDGAEVRKEGGESGKGYGYMMKTTYIYIHLSVYPFIYTYTHPSLFPHTHPSTYLSIHLPTYPSILQAEKTGSRQKARWKEKRKTMKRNGE